MASLSFGFLLSILLSFVHLLGIFTTPCDCEWFQSMTSTLPFKQSCMAIGSYNHSIYILGGTDDLNALVRSLVVYNTRSDEFVTHPTNPYVLTDVFGFSSYYTQLGNVLYIITSTGTTVLSYNMKTKTIHYEYTTIPIQVAADAYIDSCMTSYTSNTNNYLFISGGTIGSTVQVYDISSTKWLTNPDVSPMQKTRASHTCIVDPINDILYAIGGKGGSTHLTSIEIISTNDINQKQWDYFPQSLSFGVRDTTSAYFDGIIYVIGGTVSYSASSRYDTVHMIDTVHRTVTVDSLVYGIASAPVIFLNHRLFVFGGHNGISEVDTWMYYDFPIPQPTNMPSATPSDTPSNVPSSIPSATPTSTPTSAPTQPAIAPASKHPSANPSTNPSVNPGANRSINPSAIPSVVPSARISTTTSDDAVVTNLEVQQKDDEFDDINPMDDTNIIWDISIAIGACICCIIVVCLLCCRNGHTSKPSYKINKAPHGTGPHHVRSISNDIEREMVGKDMNIMPSNVTQIDTCRETSGRPKIMNKRQKKSQLEVQEWFNDVVQLPVYYDIFMQNGYEALHIISAIESVDDLNDIGITFKNHQRKIFKEIQKLKYDSGEIGDDEQPIETMRTVEGAPQEVVELHLGRKDSFIVDGDSDSQHETNTQNTKM
eukprot:439481_1